jgi:hypothetical protein
MAVSLNALTASLMFLLKLDTACSKGNFSWCGVCFATLYCSCAQLQGYYNLAVARAQITRWCRCITSALALSLLVLGWCLLPLAS